MADIGDPLREVTFEPLPDAAPVTAPAPSAPEPDLVPA